MRSIWDKPIVLCVAVETDKLPWLPHDGTLFHSLLVPRPKILTPPPFLFPA